ncbi:hypothetical protein Q1695_004613 [Nippostrongylus brasiliensis]|nr:hypothetical protein Q1695_004613 [Nippostrongylus brasiliensis]
MTGVNDWYSNFLSRRVVSIRREVPPSAITEGYALVIRKLRITKLNHQATYRVSCYFFDAKCSQFFGCPYQSVDRQPDQNECSIDEDLFFHCPHLGDGVQLVIEVVETVGDPSRSITVAWGLVPISGYGETILDYSRLPAGFDLQRIKLYPGSPKVLTFSAKSHHESTSTGSLECSLYSHSRLVDAVDYFPEFCIIGNRYDVPGLLLNESGPQLADPQPMSHVNTSLDEISLSFGPHAAQIEKLILDDINTDRLYRENQAPSTSSAPANVLERRLRIGVHNGFAFLFEPLVVHLSSVDEQLRGTHSLRRKGRPLSRSSSDIRSEMNTLFVRARVSLPKMADDERLVVVFALDYLIGTRVDDKASVNSQSVIICWGAWQPFANRAQLHLNGRLQASVSLIGGPRPNPEESLCFRNLLHLYRRDDSIFTESAPKITIQFSFVLEDTHYGTISRSTTQMGDTSRVTPAPRREMIETEVEEVAERKSPPPRPAPDDYEGTSTETDELLPPIVGKKRPTTVPSKLHQKIDSVIDQESPRTSLPISYSLPLKEARVTNVLRSVYAALSNVQFPGVFDRCGDPPVLVDVTAQTLPSRAVEINDGLNTNEIIVQFMAMKCLHKHEITPTRKVFFTLQFYRFQQITTEQLLLCESNSSNGSPSILKRLNANDEEISEGGAGFMAKFLVDRQRRTVEDRDEFISYLSSNSLCVEVWDAESLLYVGASYVPLQSLLRNGKEAVQCTIQCPVVFSALPGPPVVVAVLYLRMANIGHPSSNQIVVST